MNLIPWRGKREDRSITRVESQPFERLREEFSELMRRFWQDPWGSSLLDSPLLAGWGPRMEMSETDKDVSLRFELPGVRPEDVDIQVCGNVLTVRGEKGSQRQEQRGHSVYSERSFGRFSRSVQLPSTVDPERVDASYKDGILTVTLAKRPDAKVRRVKVRKA